MYLLNLGTFLNGEKHGIFRYCVPGKEDKFEDWVFGFRADNEEADNDKPDENEHRSRGKARSSHRGIMDWRLFNFRS
jgi:hypothetical protein